MTPRPHSDHQGPFKIAQVTTETGWRGGENQIAILAKSLPNHIAGRKANHCVIAPAGSALQTWAARESIDFQPWTAANDIDLLAAWRLKSIAELAGIHLVHTHSARAHGLAVIAKQMGARFRLVVHRRTNFPIATHLMSRWKYRHHGIDHFIAISAPSKNDLFATGISPERVTVIHSAAAFRPATVGERQAARAEQFAKLGIRDPSTILVTFAGQLEESKGIFDLVQALANLRSPAKLHLALAGTGPAMDKLKGQAASAIGPSTTSLLGFQADLRPLFAASDIFCLPSHAEGLGTVLLEAIDAGAACCGSQTGGIPEILIDQRTGLTFPPGNIPALQRILERLISDTHLRKTLTDQARLHVQQHFSVQGLISELTQVYTTCLTDFF